MPANHRVSTNATLVDCFPTIIDCVGADHHPDDADLPGQSLFDLANSAPHNRVAFSEYHAAASATASFMVREGDLKLVYFVGMEPLLYDLAKDPDETTDLAQHPDYLDAFNRIKKQLYAICDPDIVDAQARQDQQATIAQHGGREAILARGDFGYSPAPGQPAVFDT